MKIQFVDAHHHFLDTTRNEFQSFLGSLVTDERYVSDDYNRDVVEPLRKRGLIDFIGSVHVECMPDNGIHEAQWVQQLSQTTNNSQVAAIVASVDLTCSNVKQELQSLRMLDKVRGIRWILDYFGPYNDGKNATHVATTRGVDKNGMDYLSHPDFERGYAMLQEVGFSFDLQCAPSQLLQAAKLITKYPNIPVCINHLGKPRRVLLEQGEVNEKELETWREGMRQTAKLPHVYVKISMLGYIVPGWIENKHGQDLIQQLVRETIQMFGPSRCMVALNWWKDAAISDSDGFSTVGPDPLQFVETCNDVFFAPYTEEEKQWLFCDTARKFYKF